MNHVVATRGGNLELRSQGANPYLEWGNTSPLPPSLSGASNVGGLHVTTETATQVAAVYGCCSTISDSVVSLPLRVLDEPAWVNTAKELKTAPLLERPYEPISRIDWISCLVWSLALRGNFFGQVVERDRLGYPLQIMPVHPDVVAAHPVRDTDEIEWKFAGKKIPPEDVFHVRYQAFPGALMGLNPIQVAAHSFGIARVQDIHTENVYRNGADPRGVIQSKRELTEANANALKARWNALHQGPNHSSEIAVLDNESEFKPITVSPADLQLLEARKWSSEEISGMIFRVPAHKLGLTERQTSYGRGIEQQERSYVTDTLAGYLSRAELALTECLPPGQFANFNLHHRIRGDSVQRAETGFKLMMVGAWCADDVRATFDQPPLPNGEGKIFHSPANSELLKMQLVELERMEKEPDEPAEPQQPAVPASSNGKGKPQNVPVLR